MHPPPHTLAQLQSGALAGLRRLDLSCGLGEFPREIFELADTLEMLNLSGNALRTLPDDLHRLQRLRVLFCSDNPFTELPAAVGRCAALEVVGFKACRIEHVSAAALPPALRWLILTDNCIATLPDALGRRPRLQKLMLAGNRLQALPATLAACTRLELVRIAANRFDALPHLLLGLPRLAWLAYAGNPFSDALQAAAMTTQPETPVDWHTLRLGDKIGEGASGWIHHALWQRAAGLDTAVAVKLFKGAMTSDGLPRSEMAACLTAGAHPNLIGVEGCVANHPQGAEGLVMRPIAPHFRTLARPPSLDSCTRDVYAEDMQFTPRSAHRLTLSVASAMQHLHARGVLHGDLYAHNILHDDSGEALLGDFGAASFLPLQDAAATRALQCIEGRALAWLMEEITHRCCATPADAAGRATLKALHAATAAALAGAPVADVIERLEQATA